MKTAVIKTDLDNKNFVKGAKEMDSSVADVEKTTEGLSNQLDKMTGGAVTAFKSIVTGAKSGVKAMFTFRGAVMATGIGALVVAVGSLVAWFTKTEKGAQTLRVAMAAISAVTNTLVDLFVDLGETIYNAVTNPMDALKNLGNGIKDFLMNPLGSVSDVAAKATAGMNNLVSSISDNVKSATDLEKRMNALIVSERNLAIEQSARRARIKELNKDAEDITLGVQRQSEAAKEAIAIEQELMNQRMANAAERLAIIKAQNALASSDEQDLQAEADAEIALNNIRMESNELQTTLQNKLNILNNQAAAQRAKEFEDRKAAREELIGDIELLDSKTAKEVDVEKMKQEAILKTAEIAKKANNEMATADAIRVDEEIERANQLEFIKTDLAQNAANAIIAIAGRQSAIAKGVAIAQGTQSTLMGINKALAETTDFTPTQSLRFANAALIGITGFANVARIAASNPMGGSGGGGANVPRPAASGGGGMPSTPRLPNLDALNLGVGGASDGFGSEVYVSTKTIDDKRALSQRIKDSSRL